MYEADRIRDIASVIRDQFPHEAAELESIVDDSELRDFSAAVTASFNS